MLLLSHCLPFILYALKQCSLKCRTTVLINIDMISQTEALQWRELTDTGRDRTGSEALHRHV